MKIVKADVFPLLIPFKRGFRISRGQVGGARQQRTVVLVRMEDELGHVGWGEGSPSSIWSSETMESVVSVLRDYFIPSLLQLERVDIDTLHRTVNRVIGESFSTGHPIAKCALDTAFYDLLGKRTRLSVRDLLGYSRTDEATLSWTVSAADLEQAKDMVHEGLSEGYRNFNIKLAVTPRHDVALCEWLRSHVPDSFMWGDANGGYTADTAYRTLPALAEAGLHLLEQPFPSNRLALWREWNRRLELPLAADEGVVAPTDLVEFIRLDMISAHVAKVARNGGLFPSVQCAQIAENAGLPIIASGLTETGLGIAAHLHLACAFGIRTPCAWNGPQYLHEDILAVPLQIRDGRVRLPAGHGIGVTVDEDKVKFYGA